MQLTGEFLVHVTTDGERWDQIADRYYGDPGAFAPIARANAHVALVPLLPAGLELLIPVIAEAVESTADLPPWKRGTAS